MEDMKNGEQTMTNTMTKIRMRPFCLEDAEAARNLFNAYSRHIHGRDAYNLADLLNEWTSPGHDIENVIRVVENGRGEIIGYIEVWDVTDPHVVKYLWGVIHPDAWEDAHYQHMLLWAESCARSRIALAPKEARIVMSMGIPHTDSRRKRALESYGFDLVRHFFRMEIALNGASQDVILPRDLRIETIDLDREFRNAVIAMDDAFSDHWGHVPQPIDQLLEQWEHNVVKNQNFDPALWFLAKDGDRIAGACRCSAKMVEDPQLGWVNQLCVGRPWRRQGLGTALLKTAFNAFQQRGKARVGLGVDANSLTHATRLYEKAGMHITRQYDTYDVELRPGVDLTKK